MKKIIMVLVLSLSCLIANDKDISLLDFTELVSIQNNINIYIDDDIKKQNISLFVPEQIANEDLFFVYKKTLLDKGFVLVQYNNIYYIRKDLSTDKDSFFIPLKYNSYDNVSKYLTFKNIKFQYVDTTNTFIVYSPPSQIGSIMQDIKKIDSQKKQIVLKFTIIEVNNDKLEQSGIQYSTLYKSADGAMQNVLNTLILPFQSEKPIFNNVTFYGALKLFNEDNLLSVNQNPYILVQDSKDFLFQAVTNIPYQTSKTLTQATNTSEQTSIEYRDVGLKVIGKSLIYADYVNLDLDLIIEDILNINANIPTTYKRQLKSNTNLKYGEVLLLSGIKQTKKNKTDFSVPFISNIPYLGEIFKYKSESNVKSNISIAIEVLKNDEAYIQDD